MYVLNTILGERCLPLDRVMNQPKSIVGLSLNSFPVRLTPLITLRFRPNQLNMMLNSCHHLKLLILLCLLTGRYEAVRNQRRIILG